MPTSKSKRRRYQLAPTQQKKKPKASPRWFGIAVLAIIFIGVIIIVVNYLGLVPGTGGRASNAYLFVGLGLIAVGFIAATQWR